jgi:carboxymethylenebutenolidase
MINRIRLFTIAAIVTGLLAFLGCDSTEDESTYGDDLSAEHADDAPEASAIAMEPILPVQSDFVVYGVGPGVELRGYLAEPQDADSVIAAMSPESEGDLPGLIIIHEWWGLNDNIQLMARRFAGEGFRVLAVDFYDGQVTENPEQAREAVDHVMQNPAAVEANLRAAHTFLREQHDAVEIAILGWCFGGSMTLRAITTMPADFDAAVIYYGSLRDMDRDAVARTNVPVLAFFGEEDGSIPLEQVRDFEDALRRSGTEHEVHVYADAGHAFANPSGRNFVEAAARDAWDRTAVFLREHLYGEPTLSQPVQ